MNKSFVLRVSIVAAIGGLLFGYDTAVIAGVIGNLKTRFHLSSAMEGSAVGSAIWGCVVGAMLAGYLSDRMGRKKVLIITAMLFFVSSITAALAEDLTQFILARVIGGLGIGAASMLSPLYIAEIAPANSRGRLVSLYQLAIVLGINLIYFVNLRIAAMGDETWNIDSGWRYMLASGVLPALLFLLLLFFVPESPRWLIARDRKGEALDILKKVNGEEAAPVVYNEIADAVQHETGTLKELFKPGLRMAMLVGAFLALFCQITGINAIIYYAPEIFKSAGFGAESAFKQTVIIGVINTLFTFIAILFIDRAGRKALLLWGITGMIICLLAIGACYYFQFFSGPWLLICILGYIASFACSLGPVPWVIMAEIFPTKTRGVAMSFATVVLWVGVVLITQLTPILLEKLGGAFTFWLFMVNAIILLVFTWNRVPETRQRTLEDIEKSWTRKV